jgi:hypothetical protein
MMIVLVQSPAVYIGVAGLAHLADCKARGSLSRTPAAVRRRTLTIGSEPISSS